MEQTGLEADQVVLQMEYIQAVRLESGTDWVVDSNDRTDRTRLDIIGGAVLAMGSVVP